MKKQNKKQSKENLRRLKFIVELHKEHNELYFLPARAAALLRHLSEAIVLIEFLNASKCVTDVRN